MPTSPVPTTSGRIWWLLLLAAVPLSLVVGVFALSNFQAYKDSERWVHHTYEVIDEMEHLFSALGQAEAEGRGFIIAGETAFLERFRSTAESAQASARRLRALTADNPRQQQRLDRVEPMLASRLRVLQELIQIRQTSGLSPIPGAMAERRGPELSATLKDLLSEIRLEEQELLEQRSRITSQQAFSAAAAIGGGTLALLVLVSIAAVRLGREEKSLRKSEANYRRLVEGVHDYGIFGASPDGVITAWNAGMQRITGYTSEEATGKDIGMMYTPEDRAADLPRQHIAEARVKGSHTRQGWKVRRDGSRFWAECVITAIRDDQGRVGGLSELTHDLTERKAAEEEQREKTATIAALLESATQAIFGFTADGRIQIANATAAQIFGYSRDELLETDINQLLPAGVIHTHMEGPGFGPDLAGRRKDGTEFPVEVRLSEIETRKGHQTVAFVSDITERKKSERELREFAATLERRVGERTEELETANQELSAFAYSVSHDLRAPLRAIDGYGLALLEDYPEGSTLDSEAIRLITKMRSSTARMAHLIEDLLNLSRVSRTAMEHTLVDISQTSHLIAEELSAREPQRQVEWSIAPNLQGYGDPRLMRILLENVIGNAWKFTSKQQAAKIEVGRVDVSGRPTFYVRDNGAGFNPEYADKLFMPFQRLHRESEFPGTGIGLATVARIVHRHGGTVRAESQLGKGATFYFSIGEPIVTRT